MGASVSRSGFSVTLGRKISRPNLRRSWLPLWAIALLLLISALPVSRDRTGAAPTLAAPTLAPAAGARPPPEQLVPFPPPNIELSSGHPGGSPSLAVDRYGELLADWMDWAGPSDATPPSIAGMAVSYDDGGSFLPATGLPAFGPAVPPSGILYESDVSTAPDPLNGTFWIGYQSQPTPCGYDSSELTLTAVPYGYSGGSASAPLVIVPCSDAKDYVDREWVASTPNGTLLQLADVPDGPDAPELILGVSWGGTNPAHPEVLADNSYIPIALAAYNDTLWAVAYATTNLTCEVLITEDAGANWSPIASPLPPSCGSAVDPPWGYHGLEWDVAWGAGSSEDGGPALDAVFINGSGVEYAEANETGSNWSVPVQISGPVPNGTIYQAPSIAANTTNGIVGVAWLDTRADPSNYTWAAFAAERSGAEDPWSDVQLLSDEAAGTGEKFWTGDSIGTVLTPWGSLAAAWGADDANGTLQSEFAQWPLHGPDTANLTVSVQTPYSQPLSGVLVEVGGRVARTDASGDANYTDLPAGAYLVSATIVGYGSPDLAESNITLTSGRSSETSLTIGSEYPLISTNVTPRAGFAPLLVHFSWNLLAGTPQSPPVWAFGDGNFSTEPNTTHLYERPGVYLAEISDVGPVSSETGFEFLIEVNASLPPLSVRIAVGGGPVRIGQPISLVALASGGTGVYPDYEWGSLPPGCGQLGTAPPPIGVELNCTPTSTGTFAVGVSVTDSLGASAGASANLTVGPAASGGWPSLASTVAIALSGAVAGGLLVTAAVLWARGGSRGRRNG